MRSVGRAELYFEAPFSPLRHSPRRSNFHRATGEVPKHSSSLIRFNLLTPLYEPKSRVSADTQSLERLPGCTCRVISFVTAWPQCTCGLPPRVCPFGFSCSPCHASHVSTGPPDAPCLRFTMFFNMLPLLGLEVKPPHPSRAYPVTIFPLGVIAYHFLDLGVSLDCCSWHLCIPRGAYCAAPAAYST